LVWTSGNALPIDYAPGVRAVNSRFLNRGVAALRRARRDEGEAGRQQVGDSHRIGGRRAQVAQRERERHVLADGGRRVVHRGAQLEVGVGRRVQADDRGVVARVGVGQLAAVQTACW